MAVCILRSIGRQNYHARLRSLAVPADCEALLTYVDDTFCIPRNDLNTRLYVCVHSSNREVIMIEAMFGQRKSWKYDASWRTPLSLRV